MQSYSKEELIPRSHITIPTSRTGAAEMVLVVARLSYPVIPDE
jgi:hypothetical protein